MTYQLVRRLFFCTAVPALLGLCLCWLAGPDFAAAVLLILTGIVLVVAVLRNIQPREIIVDWRADGEQTWVARRIRKALERGKE